ncbi:MAG: hypothetical protein GY746_10980 [Gammaproteobacteria bacterium]|nr:hypothetical protein [Gammaproteobacteria bacterium]
MAETITGNVGSGVIAVLAADTTILDLTADRAAITAFSLHNTNAATVTVTVYISPDLTSASGAAVDYISIATDETKEVTGLIGQGIDDTENIIAVGSLTGVNAVVTITEYVTV